MRSKIYCFLTSICLLASSSLASAGLITQGISVTSQAGPRIGVPVADTANAYDSPTNATAGAATSSLTISAPVFDLGAGTITYSGVATSAGAVTDRSTNILELELLAECDFAYTFEATSTVANSGAFANFATLNLFAITNQNTGTASDAANPDSDPFVNIGGTVLAGDTPTFGFFNENRDDAPLIGGLGDGFEYSYAFELVLTATSPSCVCSVPEPSSFLFLGLIGMVGCGCKRFFGVSVETDA